MKDDLPIRGRPTKLTETLQKAICKELELSVPEKYAAEMNGLHEDTFHLWMRQGAEEIEPYASFYQAVTRARAKAVGKLTRKALGGGKGSSLSVWFLERRFRKEYAPVSKEDEKQQDKIIVENAIRERECQS